MKRRVAGFATVLACWVLVVPAPPVLARDHPNAVRQNQGAKPAIVGEEGDEPLRSSPDAVLLPGVGGLYLGADGSPGLKGIDEALIIKMTYRAVAKSVRRSGYDLRFDLSDFRTHYRADFRHLFLSDLMSVAPKSLEIEYTEVDNGEAGAGPILGAAYEPAWKTPEGGSERSLEEWGRTMTYDEVLRMAASEPESQVDDPNQVVAVTSYLVRVFFQEQTEDYRAMFVWLADEDGATRFLPQDFVTQRVDEIWELSRHAAPIQSLLRGEPAPSIDSE